MIYLKEFNTTEEYNAFVESGEMIRPNVSLVNEPFRIYYNKYIQLGVFIQHIDGTRYTEAEWTSGGFSNNEANGVAVVADKAKFVIAKESLGMMAWSSNNNSLVDGILATADEEIALTDFAGYHNTQLMLATDTSGAGYSCANFTFPNGDKGYLPALGELSEAYANLSKINSLMNKIGGKTIDWGMYRSSTQYDSGTAWQFHMGYGHADHSYGKNQAAKYYVRAFTTLPL